MTLKEIIDYADHTHANAFEPEDKVRWLNELENAVQTDMFGQEENLIDHCWADHWTGEGIAFPDDATVVIPGTLMANPGGIIHIDGLQLYPANERRGIPVLGAVRSGGYTTITTEEGTFAVGTVPETGTARIEYDGAGETMAAPEIWHKIYYTYLEARIDAQNSEWGLYANDITLHNHFMGEFQRWYARNYIDPED